MSGLDGLPPDQRAVLQLILVQGRGYGDLAATLRLDASAVRERAHAAAGALAGATAAQLDADTRGRVVDYLLGQQDDGERIVTFAALGESPAACRWAQELRAHLAPVAREELPEVPASATVAAAVNGSGAAAPEPAPAPQPVVADPAAATAAIAAIPPVPMRPRADAAPTSSAAAPPPAPPRDPETAATGGPPRPSRLGGAILIAGALALVVVLAIVLIGNGNDGGGSGSAAATGAQTQTTRTTPRAQTSTTGTNARAQARTVGGAVLRSPTGGSGLGAALVQQGADGRRLLAVEAARLPGNAGTSYYAIWLQGAAGNRFLGFVPRQVRANGTFTVSSALPKNLSLSSYSTVLLTSEDGNASAAPTTPGATVLSGPLRLAG